MGDPRRKLLCAAVAWLLLSGGLLGAPPRLASDGFQLEMVASDPDIVTPIGLSFDSKGRLLVVESQTHQRPQEYAGPADDRIRLGADSDGDGRLDRWTTFAEGFYHAMNILARPDGAVYVVTRHNIVLLRDTNDDGVADKQEEILRLETKGDYPHNGLSGIARQPLGGNLWIGLGENQGLQYRLIDAKGKTLTGEDGAGAIFNLTENGGSLQRLATGFWNPFGICTTPDGRVFVVDNDPDASPPCRLLHVVPGGDYGFRYQYGRAGTHPLQAWNGELPGTLPMVCGVGEGPTAVVAHGGWLWVTSWGDHRIERYRLVPRGASYAAEREVIVQGDVDFRPTGMALAPDGSLYFGDWVLRDYPVHGRGRIWRLTLPKEDQTTSFPPRSEADLAASNDDGDIVANAASNDPFIHAHAVQQLLRHDKLDSKSSPSDRLRLAVLEAQRLQGVEHSEPLLRAALQDESTDVRLFAVRWIADDRITALRDDVAKLLEGPQPNARYYLAVLATLDWLDSEPKLRGRDIADEILERELKNEARTADAHALALGLISPDNKFLTLDLLRNYLAADHAPLRLAAVRALAQQSNSERFELLATTARDESQSDEVRAEAIMGLAAVAETYRDLLQQFAQGDNDALRGEAERVLRLARQQSSPSETKPPADDLAAWNERLKQPGDAAAGRRLFFSGVGARCGVCHQHDGHGGRVGPDLTHVGRSSSRDRIIASILQPSQEIAPHYQPWLLTTDDGKTHLGLRVVEGGNNDTEMYIDSAGQQFSLKCKSVESREVATKSIMPDGLESAVSIADLRDLVTFLMQSNDDGTP